MVVTSNKTKSTFKSLCHNIQAVVYRVPEASRYSTLPFNRIVIHPCISSRLSVYMPDMSEMESYQDYSSIDDRRSHHSDQSSHSSNDRYNSR